MAVRHLPVPAIRWLHLIDPILGTGSAVIVIASRPLGMYSKARRKIRLYGRQADTALGAPSLMFVYSTIEPDFGLSVVCDATSSLFPAELFQQVQTLSKEMTRKTDDATPETALQLWFKPPTNTNIGLIVHNSLGWRGKGLNLHDCT